MYLFALVMIVLNLAAFGIGMSKQRPVEIETEGGSTEQQTSISGQSALGTSPLRG